MTLTNACYRLLQVALLMMLVPVLAAAQTTFTVTTASPDGSHPNPNPFSTVYVIDGVQGAELFLKTGKTYTFQMDNVPSLHPFYLTTSPAGGGSAAYMDGVTGNGATGNGTVTFTPSMDAPDSLYYGCMNHQNMGWKIHIVREVVINLGFNISVVTPDGSHPDPNANPDFVFAVSGVQGGEIAVERGNRYLFVMNNVPGLHPFFISTQPAGPGTPAYMDGVEGNGSTGNDTLIFTVPQNAPDTLYYGCMNHPNMGWRIIVLPGQSSGVKDEMMGHALSSVAPNPVRGSAEFTLTPPRSGAVWIALIDASGRQVQLLHEGTVESGVSRTFTLDAASIPAGIYHLQVSGAFHAGQTISVVR